MCVCRVHNSFFALPVQVIVVTMLNGTPCLASKFKPTKHNNLEMSALKIKSLISISVLIECARQRALYLFFCGFLFQAQEFTALVCLRIFFGVYSAFMTTVTVIEHLHHIRFISWRLPTVVFTSALFDSIALYCRGDVSYMIWRLQ